MSLVSGEKSNFQFILRLLNTNVDGSKCLRLGPWSRTTERPARCVTLEGSLDFFGEGRLLTV